MARPRKNNGSAPITHNTDPDIPDHATILFHAREIEQKLAEKKEIAARLALAKKRAIAAGMVMSELDRARRALREAGTDAAEKRERHYRAYTDAFQLDLFGDSDVSEMKKAETAGFRLAFTFGAGKPDDDAYRGKLGEAHKRGWLAGQQALAVKQMELKEMEAAEQKEAATKTLKKRAVKKNAVKKSEDEAKRIAEIAVAKAAKSARRARAPE